jgi:hypothetical protein
MILDGQKDLLDLLDTTKDVPRTNIAFTEYNADMLLSYDNTFGNFSVKFSYGANSMNQYTLKVS